MQYPTITGKQEYGTSLSIHLHYKNHFIHHKEQVQNNPICITLKEALETGIKKIL